MCILSQAIKDIASTHIFVNDLGQGVHATIYSMKIETETPVAMLLPVPVAEGSGEDAVEFVDLSSYSTFFDDLDKLFPNLSLSRSSSSKSFVGVAAGPLKVHQVGAFKASYVPSMKDFTRLDRQFRLPVSVLLKLPDYSGYGFAVFQFDPGAMRQIHPMAYRYPTRNPNQLFFPTVHVHDGQHADPMAHFDHKLYYQHSSTFSDTTRWDISHKAPDSVLKMDKTGGLVQPGHAVYRNRMRGDFPNADQLIVTHDSFCTHSTLAVRV